MSFGIHNNSVHVNSYTRLISQAFTGGTAVQPYSAVQRGVTAQGEVGRKLNNLPSVVGHN